MSDGDLSGTQWAAVTIHCGWTKVPPQKGKPEGFLIWTCHGQAPLGASAPPTIRGLGLKPHCSDPPLPPLHRLQLFLQFRAMNAECSPLQSPLLAQEGQPALVSLQPESCRKKNKIQNDQLIGWSNTVIVTKDCCKINLTTNKMYT